MRRSRTWVALTATIAALAAPGAWANILTVTKVFNPAIITAGASSTITITITNAAPGNPSNIAFTDVYPAGLVNAATPALTNTCGGTATALAGSTALQLTGGSVSGNKSCTVTVAVTAALPGLYTNPSFTVTSSTNNVITAPALLTVTPGLVGSFNAFESGVAAGATSGPIYTRLAGVAFSLDVVALSGGVQAATFSGAVTVELLGNAVTGVALDAQNCPVSFTLLQTVAPNPTITGGRSTVTFAAVGSAWRDVRVRIRYPTTLPTVTACSTDNFAIRPAAFFVTSTNAGNVNATGTPALVAGANFNLTAAAVAGYNGVPQLDNAQVVGSPVAGAIAGVFSAASPATGVAVGNAFSYGEVGNFGLNANAVFDQAFTAADQPNDCTLDFSTTPVGGRYGCWIGSAAVPLIPGASGFGRFIPDHFDTVVTQVAGVPMACAPGLTCPAAYNGMAYSGQPFTVNLYAKNAAGAVTQDYDNGAGYARQVTLSAASGLGGAIATAGAISAGATVPALSFKSGTTALGTPAAPVFSFATSPTAPSDIYLRAIDSDGVTSLRTPASSSTEGGVKVVSGRLNIANAYGSELLQLPIRVAAQYWDGSSWTTSTTDSATALNATATGAPNWTNFTPGNWQPLSFTAATGPTAASAAFTLANGLGSFTLSAPGAAGSVDISLNAPPYLLPSTKARATFGVYKGSDNFIYQRESY